MGVVLLAHNPFDAAERSVLTVKRPMTIRRLVSRRRELRPHTSVRRVLGRRTRDFTVPTVCVYNGQPVLRRDWSRTVIAADDVVVFQALPAGGGGGGSNPLQIVMVVAMIAIAVAAPYLAGPAVLGFAVGSLGFSLATAGIGLALSAAVYGVMSLFVPPPPAAQGGGDTAIASSPAASPTYNFQARGNTARLGSPIPELFGRHVIYPDYAHEPYVSFEGNEQYLHLLMVVTQGYCDFLETRIGETPTANFPEVVWQKVEPGQTVDADLVDPMMLTSHDLAEVELAGTEAGSPWYGPFIVNPPGTTVTAIQIDYAAPGGLYFINYSAGLSPLNFTLQLDVQTIDDDGTPTGGWTTVELIYQEEATRTPLRWTYSGAVGAARYQARVRRLDTKNGSASASHSVYWTGLRGHQPGARTFPGVTLWAVKARATGNLGSVNSKQFNVIAIRKLPTYNGAGGLTAEIYPTRDPCDAAAYICMAANAGRLTEQQVDLAGIYAHRADYASRGWTFDAVFDTSTTCWEALSKVGRAVVAQPVVQGPRVRLIRDLPSSAPAMIFTPRNITKNSLELSYRFPDEKTADAIDIEFMDPRSWRWSSILVSLPGSTTENPTTMRLVGITNRKQAIFAGTMLLRANKYRRRQVTWGTEMEGLLLLYGDNVRLSHDMPAWGQAAEAIAYDPSTRILSVSEPLSFTAGGTTHYAALRKRDGSMAGPYVATEIAGDPKAIMLGAGEIPPLSLAGDAERTHVVFGPGETYAKPLKVTGINPRSVLRAEVTAIDDDPRMYEPVPGV